MRRKLFTLAAGVSAVLFVGICVLWVRSYWRGDYLRLSFHTPGGSVDAYDVVLFSAAGGFEVDFGTSTWNDAEDRRAMRRTWTWDYMSHEGPRYPKPGPRAAWFYQGPSRPTLSGADEPGGRAQRLRQWLAPHATWAAPAAILPAIWFIRRRTRAKRSAAGLCPACGYDLRATPERCPECGKVPTAEGTRAPRHFLNRGKGD